MSDDLTVCPDSRSRSLVTDKRLKHLTLQVNPVTLIDKLSKMADAISILKREFEQLVSEQTELKQGLDKESAELEERIRSTLTYLVSKQK